jgi:hypothetical protein
MGQLFSAEPISESLNEWPLAQNEGPVLEGREGETVLVRGRLSCKKEREIGEAV